MTSHSPSIHMIELKEDIGQLTEELAFLTATLTAKIRQAAELEEMIKHLDMRRAKAIHQLDEAQNSLSGLLKGTK